MSNVFGGVVNSARERWRGACNAEGGKREHNREILHDVVSFRTPAAPAVPIRLRDGEGYSSGGVHTET